MSIRLPAAQTIATEFSASEAYPAGAPSTDRTQSTRYVWYVIFLLFTVNVFNYTDRMALSVLAPSVKADLNLSDAQLGLLIGFAFSVFYAICGLPMARWADRGNRRNIIAITLAIWSAMTALSGAAQNFWHLFATRMGVGVGEAGCVPTGQSIISDYVPPNHRAGFFAVHSLGLMVGMMVGMALAGWLADRIGWRWTFVCLGLPGLVLAMIVRVTLREPPRGNFDAVKDEGANLSFARTMAVLFRCRTYVLLLLALLVNGFSNYGLTQWWPSFYARQFELSISTLGLYLGVAIGVGSAVGLLSGGLLANKVSHRNAKLPLIVSAAATALAVPAALGSLFVSSTLGSFLLVALTAVFWTVHNGPVVALIYNVVPTRMRATAVAVCLFFVSVLGLGLGPFVVGLLSDILTPTYGKEALRWALLSPICLLPLMALALLAAAKQLPNDLRAQSAQV